MLKKQILLYIIVFSGFTSYAQDSLKTLNAEQVLALVKQFHPVVRQTTIEIEKAKADITVARGAFDPILSYYAASKTFNGTNYYNDYAPEIKIPTWYGVEVSGGLENLTGNRLDPSSTPGKTSYLGVSIPLAKNLIIDKRRAFLQQARIFNTMAEVEQRAVINDLLMSAAEAYWNWLKAYQTFVVVRNNVEINKSRVDFIRRSFVNGERAAIDTVEAVAQLQSFQYQQNQHWVEFQNAGLELSVYLWKNNNEPYILPETVVPQDGWENEVNILNFNLVLTDLLTLAENNHPDLQLYNYKLDVLNIDKKLKFQELLPKIDFRYNQLNKGYNLLETATTGPLFRDNFQYGLKIEFPLRFSQGRGEYKKARLKIEETTLDQNQKKQQIELKVRSYYNEFLNLKAQIALQSNNYNNYLALVRAEETKLRNGESSLFLINSRENKALEALEKLIELKAKYYKTIYSLQWSAGLLQQ
jgi:outer membrane protein TolC